tara:strand:+ start:1957 stop:2325 length:369 start_codon:yes stop_codon:yes gene_type:complete
MTSNSNVRIKNFKNFLNDKIPLVKPVKLIQRKLKDYFGYCYEKDSHFILVVSKDFSYYQKIDTIIHEYAHAMTMSEHKYNSKDEKTEHDARWGACYAQAYRCYLDFIDETKPEPNKDSDKLP